MKAVNHEANVSSVTKAEFLFDWKAFMVFLLETQGEREKIGPAWFLFLNIVHNMNRSGIYQTTYAALATKYDASVATVKKWRKWLCKSGAIESYSRGHSVAFRLLEPYMSFVKAVSKDGEDQDDLKGLLVLKRLLSKTINEKELNS